MLLDVQLTLPDIECAMYAHVYAHAFKQLLISKCICCCVHAYDVCMHVQATCVVSICLGLYQTPMAQNCVWQINQSVLLQHPCSTTHVCNFLHTLSMQHALSMQLHCQLNTTDSCKLPFRIILRLITTDLPHLPHLAILTNLMLHMF